MIPVDDLGAKIENLTGNITFSNVSFSYANRKIVINQLFMI